MKRMKKFLAFVLAMIMCLGMTVTAFAQEESAGNGPASIKINKASKGETYSVYKIFDAVESTSGSDSVFSYKYTKNEGKLPATYEYTVSETNEAGETVEKTVTGNNIFFEIKDGMVFPLAAAYKSGEFPVSGTVAEMSDGAIEYLKYLASNEQYSTKVDDYVAESSPLVIKGLEYGYYLVTSTLNGGSAVSVNGTNPQAVMNEKNSSEPTWTPDPEDPDKKGKMVKPVNGTDAEYAETLNANIGDTVTFRLRITTQNYNESGQLILSYEFKDDVLSKNFINVNITSVKVLEGDTEKTPVYNTNSATGNFPIHVDWVDDNRVSLYKANSILEVVYTAELATTAVIDHTGNVNTASFSYTYADPENPNDPGTKTNEIEDTATVFTYALAFEKINTIGELLAGAEFTLPFYVVANSEDENNNVYVHVKDADVEGATNKVTTKNDGVIIIKGVAEGSYNITESKAPSGYNAVEGDIVVTATKTGEEKTKTKLTQIVDANGKVVDESTETTITTEFDVNPIPVSAYTVVVNRAGNLLPSTGGIGTTIFYVVGGLLVAGAGILLITKKRMKKEQ